MLKKNEEARKEIPKMLKKRMKKRTRREATNERMLTRARQQTQLKERKGKTEDYKKERGKAAEELEEV